MLFRCVSPLNFQITFLVCIRHVELFLLHETHLWNAVYSLWSGFLRKANSRDLSTQPFQTEVVTKKTEICVFEGFAAM